MGACNTKLTISDSLSVELSSNPNDKVLLMLQLHYDMYDTKSQKKIDELCQLSMLTDHSVHLDFSRGDPVDPPKALS
jgi:hypothetical protein